MFEVEKRASAQLTRLIENQPAELIKTAADWNSKQALNDLFGLELVNKDTMAYFADMSPAFETVESALVKLLLVARLTPVGLDEELIRDTLEGVSQIKTKFSGLKSVFA
jgi:hypothetical protein